RVAVRVGYANTWNLAHARFSLRLDYLPCSAAWTLPADLRARCDLAMNLVALLALDGLPACEQAHSSPPKNALMSNTGSSLSCGNHAALKCRVRSSSSSPAIPACCKASW